MSDTLILSERGLREAMRALDLVSEAERGQQSMFGGCLSVYRSEFGVPVPVRKRT